MKRIVLCLLLLTLCPCACFAALGDADDGYLTAGEYDYVVDWTSHTPPLIVDGGGAEWIELSDFGRIEVISTSKPLGMGVGGIMDIALGDNSQLLFLDGIVEEITISDDATAILKGGRIDYIRSLQVVGDSPYITIECQPDWSWLYASSDVTGITGLWADSTSFNINFFNDDTFGSDPVWENINVVEVPEPMTLALLSLGGLLINRKKQQ